MHIYEQGLSIQLWKKKKIETDTNFAKFIFELEDRQKLGLSEYIYVAIVYKRKKNQVSWVKRGQR